MRSTLKAAIIVTALVTGWACLAGCISNQPPAPSGAPARLDLATTTNAMLRRHVGHKVTILGYWNGKGKQSGYVYGSKDAGATVVYIQAIDADGLPKQNAMENGIADGTPLEVTGTLRYDNAAAQPSGPPAAVPRALPSKHFYIDANEARLNLLNVLSSNFRTSHLRAATPEKPAAESLNLSVEWFGRITGVPPVPGTSNWEVPKLLYYRAIRTGETPVIRRCHSNRVALA